jgi:hypothetical protein
MNPRYHPKADTYILAWKGILHGKRLNALTMQRNLRQKLWIQAKAITEQIARH